MTFGPTNATPFYLDTMSDLKDKWDKLFLIKVTSLKYIEGKPIKVTDLLEIWLGGRKSHMKHGILSMIFYYSEAILR